MKRKKLDPMTVVIDVSGGVVQAVFCDLPLKVVLVDWDNIKEDGAPIPYAHDPLRDMLDTTYDQVEKVTHPHVHLTATKLEKIREAAVDDLDEACRENAGFRKTVLEGYVEKMTVQEQIDQIRDDDEKPLVKRLGFDPNPLSDDEEPEEDGHLGLPWCEHCRSYHVVPKDKIHHAALRCKAPYKHREPRKKRVWWAEIEFSQNWHMLAEKQPENSPTAAVLNGHGECGAGFTYERRDTRLLRPGELPAKKPLVCPVCAGIAENDKP